MSSHPSNTKPKLAITIGDVAGIGPEVIVGGWKEIIKQALCDPIVYGHPKILERAAKLLGLSYDIQIVNNTSFAQPSESVIPCVLCCSDEILSVQPGTIDAIAGDGAYHAIVTATMNAVVNRVDGVVTMPINKKALNLAGCHYPGHTELIAARCGIENFAMMLYLGSSDVIKGSAGLAVVHVTLHTAMQNIFSEITTDKVTAKIRLAHDFMLKMKGAIPNIGICSLNPHAGEHGLFGHEEITVIEPAILLAQNEEIHVEGPFSADTIMVNARDGKFDAVVAMFHDQGHIALKLLGMHKAVNITLGLPIVRTSVAHGTAFDIAWQGKAETSSFVEACRVASILAQR
ncbi:MAG: 4-hydroxythreonine-4-phosphate dehydrogenase PdxA [Planctomycetaceae bacterium]|nr:4-hydroxythreonine-4-phosphate dehydrogenase PdxA [Planctomycetaceae bacterium]